MKLSRISFLCLLLFLLVPSVISAQKKDDGFQAFYTKFRSAINGQNKAALKGLMSSSFIWAQDGEVSPNEAISNIGSIITWKKFWQSAKKAVVKSAERCKKPYCENRSGYHAFASSPFPVEMLFEKDSGGNWHWTGMLGD